MEIINFDGAGGLSKTEVEQIVSASTADKATKAEVATKKDTDAKRVTDFLSQHSSELGTDTDYIYLENYAIGNLSGWSAYTAWIKSAWTASGNGSVSVPWDDNEIVDVIEVDETLQMGGYLKFIRNGQMYYMLTTGTRSWDVLNINAGVNTDELEEAIAGLLNDLNESKVGSTAISTIWKGTQAEYDTLTESGTTADNKTLYIIA